VSARLPPALGRFARLWRVIRTNNTPQKKRISFILSASYLSCNNPQHPVLFRQYSGMKNAMHGKFSQKNTIEPNVPTGHYAGLYGILSLLPVSAAIPVSMPVRS